MAADLVGSQISNQIIMEEVLVSKTKVIKVSEINKNHNPVLVIKHRLLDSVARAKGSLRALGSELKFSQEVLVGFRELSLKDSQEGLEQSLREDSEHSLSLEDSEPNHRDSQVGLEHSLKEALFNNHREALPNRSLREEDSWASSLNLSLKANSLVASKALNPKVASPKVSHRGVSPKIQTKSIHKTQIKQIK